MVLDVPILKHFRVITVDSFNPVALKRLKLYGVSAVLSAIGF